MDPYKNKSLNLISTKVFVVCPKDFYRNAEMAQQNILQQNTSNLI
jgi:hypothetical protein